MILAERASDSPGSELLAAMLLELEVLYGVLDAARTPAATPADMAPPGGVFLVIYEDGVAVACGGVKRLSHDTGEIKRMFVAPAARSRGHARRMLGALESAARDLGYVRVRLDTGAAQPHAQHLYASAGYCSIPDYNGNAYAAHWFEKDL